jgi:hypothetical protein
MFSSTELFPLDCDPTTTICGKSMGFWTWRLRQTVALIAMTTSTYTNCSEDILKFVDEGDKLWIVHIDPARPGQYLCVIANMANSGTYE